MKRFFILVVLIATGCSNLQDAKPEERNSFVYFYPGSVNTFSSAAAIDSDGGIIMIGYTSPSLTDLTHPSMILTKTDAQGKTLWQQSGIYPDSLYGRAIKPVADGYLVLADRIKVITDDTNSTTITSFSINFFKMDLQGNVVFRSETNDASADFTAQAINTDSQDNVIVLATKTTEGLNSRQAVVYRFAPAAGGYTRLGMQELSYQTRNYTNGKAVQVTTTGSVIWPCSVTDLLTNRTYAAFPNLEPDPGPGGRFNSNQNIGESGDGINQHLANDLQKNSFGFATIGTTYTLSSGNVATNNNFFFARLGNNGSIVPGSVIYYDDGTKVDDPASSTIEDVGITLAPAADGGFLLVGYLTSDPATNIGNGGKDVLLIKVDSFGNVIWTNTYGGIGDEVASSAFQTPDGGYVITGTSTIQGFASLFMIKTNRDGELNN